MSAVLKMRMKSKNFKIIIYYGRNKERNYEES